MQNCTSIFYKIRTKLRNKLVFLYKKDYFLYKFRVCRNNPTLHLDVITGETGLVNMEWSVLKMLFKFQATGRKIATG